MAEQRGVSDGKRTITQKLGDLVEWFLADQGVELRFIPNPKRTGKLAPEYDFQYWYQDRQITERALAMCINCELARRNYSFVLSKVIASLTEHAWRHYVATCDYPIWLAQTATPVLKRPRGRPRVRPPEITMPTPGNS